MKCESASSGRAMDTASTCPRSRISSATSGVLMRLEAMSGIDTSSRRRSVNLTNAARGTDVTIVGTLASCQPMSVLIASTPWASAARASWVISSHVCPPATKSAIDWRRITGKSELTRARIESMTSRRKRCRFSVDPPHLSVRSLVCGQRNWLMRYPSPPMISMASYPACCASSAAFPYEAMTWRIIRSDMRRCLNGWIGDGSVPGATLSGVTP